MHRIQALRRRGSNGIRGTVATPFRRYDVSVVAGIGGSTFEESRWVSENEVKCRWAGGIGGSGWMVITAG